MEFDGLSYWSVRDDFYKKSDMTESEKRTFYYYFEKFSRIATNRFKWKFYEQKYTHFNRVIESYLWKYGHCIAFVHPLVGWLITDCVVRSYDVNNFPNKFNPKYEIRDNYEIASYKPILNRYNLDNEFNPDTDCIFITDTQDYKNRSAHCLNLIYEIVDTKEAIRTQIFNQNSPLFAIASSDKDKIAVKTVLIGMGKNQKIYVVDDDITQNLKTLNLDSPFNIEPLTNYVHELENEILEFLSMDNTQVFQKKERMITDEVESNNELLYSLYNDCLQPRKYAMDCFNKAGLKCTLEQSELIDTGGLDNGSSKTDETNKTD